MKLHVMSDLHLEFSSFEPPATDADLIVLAGDIGKGDTGISWARKAFPNKPIVYVFGNHEFYGARRREMLQQLYAAGTRNNIQILDEDEWLAQQDYVRFLGCTLWTDFLLFGEERKSLAMREGERCLSDFRVIQEEENKPFTPARSVELYEKSLAWLKAKLEEPFDGKTVVVTHHLPSMLSVVERFKNDMVAACFASQLDYLFGKMDLWIHGHTHDNLDYEVNGTRILCNPRGYVTYRGSENLDFNPGLVISI